LRIIENILKVNKEKYDRKFVGGFYKKSKKDKEVIL